MSICIYFYFPKLTWFPPIRIFGGGRGIDGFVDNEILIIINNGEIKCLEKYKGK